MPKKYEPLKVEERALIQAMLELSASMRAIARSLGRAASSVSRELKRCGWSGPSAPVTRPRLRTRGINGYWCEAAHKRAAALAAKPRSAAKLVRCSAEQPAGNALWRLVLAGLRQSLSPQQISGTLARMSPPERISHEAIYSAIYAMPRGELRHQATGRAI